MGADLIGGDIGGRKLQLTQQVVLNQVVHLDKALVYANGAVDDLQAQPLLLV